MTWIAVVGFILTIVLLGAHLAESETEPDVALEAKRFTHELALRRRTKTIEVLARADAVRLGVELHREFRTIDDN